MVLGGGGGGGAQYGCAFCHCLLSGSDFCAPHKHRDGERYYCTLPSRGLAAVHEEDEDDGTGWPFTLHALLGRTWYGALQ